MTNQLPHSELSCRDAQCPDRERCRRWVYRHVGEPNAGSTPTLREGDGPCKRRLAVVRHE